TALVHPAVAKALATKFAHIKPSLRGSKDGHTKPSLRGAKDGHTRPSPRATKSGKAPAKRG
ncbi:MAG: hypothetical protein M3037_05535, partial [Gemmatimonadota bacterium]|nr:hypothetical protein [Gemmatimonadota bacterium]